MTSVLRHHRYGRALGAGVLSVALLSGGTAGAFAATSTPSPKVTTTKKPMPTRTATMKPKPMPTRSATKKAMPKTAAAATTAGSITVSTTHKTVKHGEAVAFAGRVKGVKAGTVLVLQHRMNGKWTTLRTTTVVNRNGTFTIRRTFTAKGNETVRVVTKDTKVMSSPVSVKVS
ncbi:hypothetical protein [Streptomyces murinus]|uniref:hypothetical protein n=1 Tax=Streptomyces murinus TaxID=33900 RepID=UPI002115A408|nr:hypothetical protein [Streptomyces murinus]